MPDEGTYEPCGKIPGRHTETGYKAVSLDDLPQQREVQAAEYGEAVNPEAGWEESYHAFFGEVSSTKAEVKNSNNER